MESARTALDLDVHGLIEYELGIIESAIAMVAAGAPSVTVAGLSCAPDAVSQARGLASDKGIVLQPLYDPRSSSWAVRASPRPLIAPVPGPQEGSPAAGVWSHAAARS